MNWPWTKRKQSPVIAAAEEAVKDAEDASASAAEAVHLYWIERRKGSVRDEYQQAERRLIRRPR